jgi:hypothetical protein
VDSGVFWCGLVLVGSGGAVVHSVGFWLVGAFLCDLVGSTSIISEKNILYELYPWESLSTAFKRSFKGLPTAMKNLSMISPRFVKGGI